ncbi:FRG domain-containing protein [Yersinia bercovieri]|uniref:FRG domain-containing protein n=1 Tax=Yersinia bercovieri TaxID=634 RepID=UPI0030D51D78
MKVKESEVFGSMASPKNFSQILELVQTHNARRNNVYMWRGQGNFEWPIHSSAYRRLNLDSSSVTEHGMRIYENWLLRQARHQGYGYENGRRLSDFELLAKLQHHGAATRLIDCSRNILVALWFACRSEPNKTGLLFGLHSDGLGGVETKPENRPYNEIFLQGQYNDDSHPQTWQPPVVTKRIAAQSAHFLYSSVCEHKMGSLAFESDPHAFLAIAISPSLKKMALELLAGTFDIRHITLFPDIDGFCYAHGERFGQFNNERW